jgi:hypothetical protein
MTNIPEKIEEKFEQPRSRRGFLTWVSQVVAGASIAGIGLGLVKPLEAFAAPNCNPCTGCKFLCQIFNTDCCPGSYPILMQVQNITGCNPPGCVYQTPYFGCSVSKGICPSKLSSCTSCF